MAPKMVFLRFLKIFYLLCLLLFFLAPMVFCKNGIFQSILQQIDVFGYALAGLVPSKFGTFKRDVSEKWLSRKFIDRCFKLFLNRIHILKEKVPTVERSLSNQSFLIQELYHCKLGLNCKSLSKGYLTAVNYRLFLKVKINSIIIFALKTCSPNSYIRCGLYVSVWIMQ